MRCNICFKYASIAHKRQKKSNIPCGMALRDGMSFDFNRLKLHYNPKKASSTSHQDVINHGFRIFSCKITNIKHSKLYQT